MNVSKILLAFVLLAAGAVGQQPKQAKQKASVPSYRVRLVPLAEGLRDVSRSVPGQDVTKSQIYLKAANKYGLDLSKFKDELVAYRCADGKLFSLYYTHLEKAFGDRPYLIQRLKVTKRTLDQSGKELSEQITYLVEVFKTRAGSIKSYDQHHGGYSLGKAGRREIIKEFEIGYGEVAGHCEGTRWPFDQNHLYEKLVDYEANRSIYDAVRFKNSVKYGMRAVFDDKGNYSIESPELGFKLPGKPPPRESAKLSKDPATRRLVLTAGKGGGGIVFGKSTGNDVQKRLGKPIEDVYESATKRLISYSKGITLKVENSEITTLYTHPSFAGRTKRGIRLGDKKSRVARAYGKPSRLERYKWNYRGIEFQFDAFDRVRAMAIYKR